MLEIAMLTLIGFFGTFFVKTVLVWWSLKSWIQSDCKAQGPDYIHNHYRGRLLFMTAVMMALLLLFVVLEVAWFSRKGIMMNVIRRVPLLSEWGDLGMLAWPLWAGAFFGLLLGAAAGA